MGSWVASLAQQEPLPSLQHQFAPLVVHCAAQTDDPGRPVGRQLVHLQSRIQRIAGEYRLEESARLLEEGHQRVLGDERKESGARSGLDQRLETMRKHAGQSMGSAVLHIVVNWMVVAARRLERQEQRLAHRPAWRYEAFTDPEVLEPALLRHHAVGGGIEV